ncbi:MAG: YbaB/EbfC family nucleoid-associated protein [bacterium]
MADNKMIVLPLYKGKMAPPEAGSEGVKAIRRENMIFGNLGKMGDMMKMAKEMQGKLKQVKEELEREVYDGFADGVAVKVSGDMEVRDISVEPKMLEAGKKESLQKNLKEAANKAMKLAKDAAANKMKSVTGGLGLPGLPGM